ncbi:MAG: hypothetical protein ACQEUO_04520 [Bacillota bacterium]|uniref:Uncharacterized protein n=1 Tax=Bacillus pumilus TaxID=1408 RepID=A0A2G8IQT3_BACPU|nr:hypothetical protein [Bacillus pumilus]PIK25823.1 hypothetical protein CTV99_15965 [Bacillus pumilus]
MNEINKTNESSSFGQSKYMQIYLKQFGKDMHKTTINQQTAFKERIKKDHDSKKIKMLLGRVEDMLDNKKSSNHLTTAFFGIVSFGFASLMNYSINPIKEIHVSGPYILIIITLTIVLLFWVKTVLDEKKELDELSRYKRLLQECLDEISEKKSKRRFLKLTNKYRTP